MGVAFESGQAGTVGVRKSILPRCTAPGLRIAGFAGAQPLAPGAPALARTRRRVWFSRPAAQAVPGSSAHTGRTRTDARAPAHGCADSFDAMRVAVCMPTYSATSRAPQARPDRASAAKGHAAHLESVPLQPCGGFGQGERLPAEFIRVDQHDVEARRRAGRCSRTRPRAYRTRCGYHLRLLRLGRCANAPVAASRLAPASCMRCR